MPNSLSDGDAAALLRYLAFCTFTVSAVGTAGVLAMACLWVVDHTLAAGICGAG